MLKYGKETPKQTGLLTLGLNANINFNNFVCKIL